MNAMVVEMKGAKNLHFSRSHSWKRLEYLTKETGSLSGDFRWQGPFQVAPRKIMKNNGKNQWSQQDAILNPDKVR